MGSLTTHVLDTATGNPAAGLRIELFRLDPKPGKLADITTNADGRAAEPLLAGDNFLIGEYELRFHAGAYLASLDPTLPTPRFLDIIPIRFGISEATHYHVPLLLSPFGYSTYRGS